MFSSRVIWFLLLAIWSVSAGDIVFEDSPSAGHGNNVGTRNGHYDDTVVIESAGSPPSGDVDSRFLGLLGGGGLFGGNRPFGAIGGGIGGGYAGIGLGATKPGKCPGILGLGIGQPEGGYYPGGGFGGYGHGYPGGFPGGYGGHHGGYGYPGQYGLGGYGGFGGFRSGDQVGEYEEKSKESRRRRSDDSNKETGEAQVRALPGDTNTDARFLPGITGLFGQQCYTDANCPGQLKCCGKGLGYGATCQQPAIFG